MNSEKEYYKLSYSFESGKEYISSVGGVYVMRNKVLIICSFAVLAYCITALFLPIPKPEINLGPVIALLIFLCGESLLISYIYAAVQLRRNRELIIGVPCTLTMYESSLCEETPFSKTTLTYSDITKVIVTFDAVALITKNTAVFIPIICILDTELCEMLSFMLSNGADVNGNTMRFAKIIDNVKNISDDE